MRAWLLCQTALGGTSMARAHAIHTPVSKRVWGGERAVQREVDIMAYGSAFEDQDGNRISPEDVGSSVATGCNGIDKKSPLSS